MENLKEKSLALFMNYFSSLKIWDDFGMFQREIRLYNGLAKEFKHIYIFSYGDQRDLEYAKFMEPNITIIPKKSNLPDIIYELLLPWLQRKIIKKCTIFKTNQNSGAIAPAISKIFFKNKKLVVRSGYIGSEFARLSKFPLYAKVYFWMAENLSYRLCDKAFIPTRMNYETLIHKYPFLNGKLVEMNNFVDMDIFKKIETEKKYDIIYVARFDGSQKNHIGLLEAVQGLELKLLFIGKGTEKEKIIKEAGDRKIDLEIIEKIPNNELPHYFNASRLCAFPSTHEGNPKTLLEAMSCELPIVAFDVVGVNNIIKNRESGLLSEIDPQKMRKNIQKVIADQNLAERLGKKARMFIERNFSLKELSSKELNIYRNI